jgi:hypothetical protein
MEGAHETENASQGDIIIQRCDPGTRDANGKFSFTYIPRPH